MVDKLTSTRALDIPEAFRLSPFISDCQSERRNFQGQVRFAEALARARLAGAVTSLRFARESGDSASLHLARENDGTAVYNSLVFSIHSSR